MFAVLKTGGKQYKVASGDVLRVEKLAAKAGDKVQFNEILMVGSTVGAPLVSGAGVQAEVIDQIKGEKTINFVKRRRKHGSQRKKGHRQQLTLVRIADILESGADDSGVMAAVSGAGIKMDITPRVNPKGIAKPKAGAAPKKAAATKAKAAEKDAPAATGSDDLKKITGVGPALEKKLHEAGITSYAQIAGWSEEDIAGYEETLSLGGRVERDDWVAQATELSKA
ncbi:50S ribosomal protein L21 [Yoonia sp.]|uniref:50S ribosomal protein L21 n=1 Tax=Yoonia sp. TaxID=2212373 RepID=UPI00391B3A7B